MNVIVFVIIVGAATAWYVPDEMFNIHNINEVVIFERRNDGYITQNPEGTSYVNNDFRQSDKVSRIKTDQRFVQTTVKYNEQNHVDSSNNINNYENDHRLRTNAYTTEEYSKTGYIVQDVNVYTNRKEQKYKEDRNPVNQGAITGQVYQRGSHNIGFIKSNEQKSRPENRPAVNNIQDRRRPETNINRPIQNPQNERTNNRNHPKKPVSLLETVLIQPSGEPREEVKRLPKTDSDKEIWVWGTEGTNLTSTEPGSLNDRAAFTGDHCATGKAKVKGICVEMQ